MPLSEFDKKLNMSFVAGFSNFHYRQEMMTADRGLIDKKKPEHPFNLYENIVLATKSGKPPISQVTDMAKLIMGPGKLTAEEYYYYRLFDDNSYSFQEKTKFIGKSAQDKITRICNRNYGYWGVAHDKLFFTV